jgi:hypothetical protein
LPNLIVVALIGDAKRSVSVFEVSNPALADLVNPCHATEAERILVVVAPNEEFLQRQTDLPNELDRDQEGHERQGAHFDKAVRQISWIFGQTVRACPLGHRLSVDALAVDVKDIAAKNRVLAGGVVFSVQMAGKDFSVISDEPVAGARGSLAATHWRALGRQQIPLGQNANTMERPFH